MGDKNNMMNITLCNKVLIGDVPQYSFNSKKEALELIEHWLVNKNFQKSVFVCFQTWERGNLLGEDAREDHHSILVSHSESEILSMVQLYFSELDNENIDFAIFEFSSYEESFKYCIDLKEGF